MDRFSYQYLHSQEAIIEPYHLICFLVNIKVLMLCPLEHSSLKRFTITYHACVVYRLSAMDVRY